MAEKTKKSLTRAKAEKLIAKATTVAEVEDERFTKHANKHVQTKAKVKRAQMT
jgi:hypothetical protein